MTSYEPNIDTEIISFAFIEVILAQDSTQVTNPEHGRFLSLFKGVYGPVPLSCSA